MMSCDASTAVKGLSLSVSITISCLQGFISLPTHSSQGRIALFIRMFWNSYPSVSCYFKVSEWKELIFHSFTSLEKYHSFTRNIVKYYVASAMSDSRNKTSDLGQDCQDAWIIRLISEQIHKVILRRLIFLVENIWRTAAGIFCYFYCLLGFIWNFLLGWIRGLQGFTNVSTFNWYLETKYLFWSFLKFSAHLVSCISVKGWCFATSKTHAARNSSCIYFMSLYFCLDICTNLGELNLLNTQNNLQREPPLKPWWFSCGSLSLNYKLPSFSFECMQNIIFQGQNLTIL